MLITSATHRGIVACSQICSGFDILFFYRKLWSGNRRSRSIDFRVSCCFTGRRYRLLALGLSPYVPGLRLFIPGLSLLAMRRCFRRHVVQC